MLWVCMYVCAHLYTDRAESIEPKFHQKSKIRDHQDVGEINIKCYAYMCTDVSANAHTSSVGSRSICHTFLPQTRQSTRRRLSLKRYIHRVTLELDRAWHLALSPHTPAPCYLL